MPEVASHRGPAPRISVVIPTLDEARELDRALDHVCDLDGFDEVVVADGGSRDGAPALARAHPVRAVVLDAAGTREAQRLNAGAAAASGDVLVFLPCGLRLPRRASAAIRATCTRREVVGGDFVLRFEGADRSARLLGAAYAAQRRFGWYGADSALWCRRGAFDALGGFRQLPGVHDLDFARRLERHGRTARLPGPVTAAAPAWQALGLPRTMLTWATRRGLRAGVSSPRPVPPPSRTGPRSRA